MPPTMPKWTESDMFKFLDLYRRHDCLWNPKNEAYRSQDGKDSAVLGIIRDFGKSDFTVEQLKKKIKSIRSVYCRELAKVLNSTKNRDEVYKPTLVWFQKADAFLRAVTDTRGYKSNKSTCRASETIFIKEEDNSLLEEMTTSDCSSDGDVAEPTNSAAFTVAPSICADTKILNARNSMCCERSLESAVDNLNAIATKIAREEDEFDVFGKCVASQLRIMPLERALLCQQDIQIYLTNERIGVLHNTHDAEM